MVACARLLFIDSIDILARCKLFIERLRLNKLATFLSDDIPQIAIFLHIPVVRTHSILTAGHLTTGGLGQRSFGDEFPAIRIIHPFLWAYIKRILFAAYKMLSCHVIFVGILGVGSALAVPRSLETCYCALISFD